VAAATTRDDVLAARRVSVVKALGRPASEAEIAKRIVRVCPTRGIRFSGVSQIRNGDDNRRSLEGIL
jgi:uncharacterized protein involved in propanediol utilization